MPSHLTKDDLKDMCSEYGKMNDLNYRSGYSVAFAHYNQRDAASRAKIGLDGFPLGENTLSVNWIDNQEGFSSSG